MTLINDPTTCPICGQRAFGDHMKGHATTMRESLEKNFSPSTARSRLAGALSASETERAALVKLLYGDRDEIARFLAFLTGDDEAAWARLMALMETGPEAI